ncbi:MAG: SDR family oxidoreductase [Actinobacteria bacterium]|nr:SDR family oxidoreductase [Actinomycetota bacterium]
MTSPPPPFVPRPRFRRGLGASGAVGAVGGTDAVRTVVADIAVPNTAGALVTAALDVLVHAAVVVDSARIDEWTVAQWDRAHAVNVRAAALLVGAAVPHLVAGRHGAVVLFSSVQAQRGLPGSALYASTKGAIESLTRHLAVELGPRGVRVNAVAPGWVPADGTPRVTRYPRSGRAEEVASVVVFLAADGAAWVNGAVLAVDGGVGVVHPVYASPPETVGWSTRMRRRLRRSPTDAIVARLSRSPRGRRPR